MNHNFATVDSDNRIVYAPDTLGASLRAPKDRQYNNANYWRIDRTVPAAPDGQYARPVVVDGCEIGDLVTVQEEHIPAVDDEGEPLDPADEYRPLLKVVRQRYEFVDIPEEVNLPQPKRYSKKRFSLALAKRGIFSAFDAWADATEVIPGSGLTVKRVLADSWYMSDADDEFKTIRGVAEERFGTDKIAEVLAESEDEEW